MNPFLIIVLAGVAFYLLQDEGKAKAETEPQPAEGEDQEPVPPPSRMPTVPTRPTGPAAPHGPGEGTIFSTTLQQRAGALYRILRTAGIPCAQTMGPTRAFQQQANTEGFRLTADGKYGSGTAAALQQVMRMSMPNLAAPPSLWDRGGPCAGARATGPAGPGRPAPGRPGQGGPVTPGQADFDLPVQKYNQMGDMLTKADDLAAGDDHNAAVIAYKIVGLYGVNEVGPRIDAAADAAGWHGDSKTVTGPAWQQNGQLGAIPARTPAAVPDWAHWVALIAIAPQWATTIWLAKQAGLTPSVSGVSAGAGDVQHARALAHGIYDAYTRLLNKYGAFTGPSMPAVGYDAMTGITMAEWAPQTHNPALLLNQMAAMLGGADALLGQGDFNGAIDAYWRAGEHGNFWLAPAINETTHGQKQGLTMQAQALYSQLVGVPSARTTGLHGTPFGANLARDLTQHMFAIYHQALSTALPTLSSAVPPPPPQNAATGLRPFIPNGCFDAKSDMQVCAAVASALADETNPDKLQAFGAQVGSLGYPDASYALLSKADTLAHRG